MGLFLMPFLLVGCVQKSIYQADWKSANQMQPELPSHYDSDTKIAYEISNDEQYLYLNLVFVEESVQQQVMMSGMQVWFDTTKKNKETFGLFFPNKMKRRPNDRGGRTRDGEESQPASRGRNGVPIGSDNKGKYIQNQKQYRTIRFNGYENGLHDIHGDSELTISLSFNENGTMKYTSKIPLTCFHVNSLSDINGDDIFSFIINISGVEPPSDQAGPPGGRQGGSPSGGRGGPPGRGRDGPQGEGAQSGNPEMEDLTEDKKLEIRFKLNLQSK